MVFFYFDDLWPFRDLKSGDSFSVLDNKFLMKELCKIASTCCRCVVNFREVSLANVWPTGLLGRLISVAIYRIIENKTL